MTQKPRLTKKSVSLLRDLANYAIAGSEELLALGDKSQCKDAKDLIFAAEWIIKLCDWHEQANVKQPPIESED